MCSTRPSRLGCVGRSSKTTGAPDDVGVVHQQVDAVAAEQRPVLEARRQQRRQLSRLGGREELLRVRDDVRLERGEVFHDLVVVRMAGAHLVDEMADRAPRHLLARLADRRPGLALPGRELALDQVAQLRFQLPAGLREPPSLLFRQRRHLVPVQDLAVVERCQPHADRRAQQRHALAGSESLEVHQGGFAALLERGLEGLAPVPVLIRFEGGRDRRLELPLELRDAVAEAPALAGGQADGPRPAWVGEVVDVAPVRAGRARRRRGPRAPGAGG